MARKSIEQRLSELDARRAALKARQGKEERARDTRRKVLLGAFVQHWIEANPKKRIDGTLEDLLRREFPKFLTRDIDKQLFGDIIEVASSPTPESAA